MFLIYTSIFCVLFCLFFENDFCGVIYCSLYYFSQMAEIAIATDDDSTDSHSTSQLDKPIQLPVKRYYRQRAHCNPWSDHTLNYPIKPSDMDWTTLYDEPKDQCTDVVHEVQFVDVGCGYGGLLFALATRYPHIRSLGLELRLKVCDFVQVSHIL